MTTLRLTSWAFSSTSVTRLASALGEASPAGSADVWGMASEMSPTAGRSFGLGRMASGGRCASFEFFDDVAREIQGALTRTDYPMW